MSTTQETETITVEEIRTLNAARTILRDIDAPHDWSGGNLHARCDIAENAIFQVLNILNAHLIQEIPDELMFNKEES